MSPDYDTMDINELTAMLLSTASPPEVQRAALSALSRRHPVQRNSRLVLTMQYVVKYPDQYDQDLMMSVIDILATDPDAYATTAMLDVLPEVVNPLLEGREALAPEFRLYFYQALSTRKRAEDMAVWKEMLPQLDPKTLVGVLADPESGPLLEMLQPFMWLDGQPEPQRTKALMFVISAAARTGAPVERARQAAELLRKSHASSQFSKGLAVLEQQWLTARKSNDRSQVEMLDTCLRVIDTRPRKLIEVLTGKRPWASLLGS